MVCVFHPRARALSWSIPSQPCRSSRGRTASRHSRRYARVAPQTVPPVTNRCCHCPSDSSHALPLAIPRSGCRSNAARSCSKYVSSKDTSASTVTTTSDRTSSDSIPAWIDRTIGAPLSTAPASCNTRSRAHGCSSTMADATARVPSREPPSTMIQRSGSCVWLARAPASVGSVSASSRTGVMTEYVSGMRSSCAVERVHADRAHGRACCRDARRSRATMVTNRGSSRR